MTPAMDSTTLTIVSTVVCLLIGMFFMRARYRRANEEFEEKRAASEARRARVSIDQDLKSIEAELKGKPIPHEFREETPAKVLDFRTQNKTMTPSDLKSGESTTGARQEIPGEKNRGATETHFVSLDEALKGTRSGLMGRIRGLFNGRMEISSDDLEAVEEVLYTSDLGPETVQKLIAAVTEKTESAHHRDVETIRQALRGEILQIFEDVQGEKRDLDVFFESGIQSENKPEIWLIVGVNGAGKTTTIGKLAHKLAQSGKKVLVAAGDTFRAAAGEQLKVWTERAQVEIFDPTGIDNPSAVAFDAVKQAQLKGYDHLIIDTAGRLHTQKNLMEELKKVKRVIEKCQAGSPHEILLVLDANSGQNALVQAKEFHAALGVTGVVLTKLDGTAKGGIAVGVAAETRIPIQLIGVGEAKEDLRPFSASEFVDAIL